MTSEQFRSLKAGDWFTLDGELYKVTDEFISNLYVYAIHMIYDNGEYFEDKICSFRNYKVELFAEVYTPYQEEEADEEET